MADSLDDLVEAIRRAVGPHEDLSRLRSAAATLRTPEAEGLEAALTEWRQAFRELATDGDERALWARVIRLPQLPGLVPPLDDLVACAPRLAGGWEAGAQLGPLDVRVGLSAVVAGTGDLTTSIGLVCDGPLVAQLDAGPASVAGGLALAGDEMAGQLSATIGPVTAAAYALLSTGGTPSFVVIMAARFTPGIQLGLGFEISTVGGLIGVNIDVDVEELRAALRDGSAAAVMFPTDTASAKSALPRLLRFFRKAPGHSLVGPAAELTWLQVEGVSFLRLSVAAILRLPQASMVVLGRAQIAVPPLFDLRLDVLGEIDVPHGLSALDLAIVDGVVMGWLRVTGTAALRAGSRSPAHSVFTIGGFYPGFPVAAAGLPEQRRIALEPIFEVPIGLRLQGYFAVTDGTIQLGAAVHVGFDAGFEVSGDLQLDAIAQLDPPHLHAQLAGGVHVEFLDAELASVDFHGVLDGPHPTVLSGSVQVRVLGVTGRWRDSFTLEGSSRPAVPDLPNLAEAVAARTTPDRIRGVGGSDPHVDVRIPELPDGAPPVLPPLAHVEWTQTLVPFDVPVQRVGAARLAGTRTVTALPAAARGTAPTELFSPTRFRDADRDTLLSLPAYERLTAGTVVPLPLRSGDAAAPISTEYRNLYRTGDGGLGGPGDVPWLLRDLLSGGFRPTRVASSAGTVKVASEDWVVRGAGEGGSVASRSAAVCAAVDVRATGRRAVAVPRSATTIDAGMLWG
jgi:hypothetical protein